MSKGKVISPFTIIVTFISFALMGLALLPLLPVKLAPSRTLPSLTVYFTMPDHSARVVEMEATSRLESMLARIEGVRGIYSTSSNGSGAITLELDKHASIDAVRFEASSIIRQTWPDLPREVSYPSISVRRSDANASRPFMTFTINSAASPIVIRKYVENVIRPQLNDIPGIYKVQISGATPMEWQLTYDYHTLKSMGVTLEDIRRAIATHYATDFLGLVETQDEAGNPSWIRLTLSGSGRHDSFKPSEMVVKSQDGSLLSLDQLVSVRHIEQEPKSYYRINGLNSIYLNLSADESANQLRLSKEVHQVMENIREQLPAGYRILNSYDATQYIHEELQKIYVRSGLTVLILLLFVLVITRRIRYLFLIATSLVINLAIAVILYYLLGLEIQLYSLAGITISLSLIIDNTIIMTDHLMHKGDRRAFMPILAATLTTVGALSIIFFLEEKVRLNLQDFAAVVMVNLVVSLIVALLFVPAMVDRIHLKQHKPKRISLNSRFLRFRPRRYTIQFNRFYARLIRLMSRHKWIPYTAVILIFGLPIFLLPEKIERDTPFAKEYNRLFDNSKYKEKVKPILNKALGGTLRLFFEKVYDGSYFTRAEETKLTIAASMPNGTTLSQMNALMEKMERYLSEFPEIRQFQTDIPNPRNAVIDVYFTKAADESGFPYRLKGQVITKALQLGGGSWSVYGLQDQGFNNSVRESAGSFRVKFNGYNYDELYAWADTLRNRLLNYRRIKEVTINSRYSWFKDDYREFVFVPDQYRMALEGITPVELYSSLKPVFTQNQWIGSVMVDGDREDITISSKQSSDYDIWALKYMPLSIGEHQFSLNQLADISMVQAPQQVSKENQQYRLFLQFDYIGASVQGHKILDREVEELANRLPMGYTVQNDSHYSSLNTKDYKQYLLLGLLIVIIFFTTSILFNSLKQPLAVICIIPISYIGVFLTFYLFRINFDQGGFASFVLLSGITVNAAIYILNDFNNIRMRRPGLHPLKAYIKAWNSKAIPIFLTVVSTILGFIPFLIGTAQEAFWFPLAACTIGGLVVSLLGIGLILPLLALRRSDTLQSH